MCRLIHSKPRKAPRETPRSISGTDLVTIYCEDESEDEQGPQTESDDELEEEAAALGGDEEEEEEESGKEIPGATVAKHSIINKALTAGNQSNTPQKSDSAEVELQKKQDRTFVVHKSFACCASRYFDRVFNNQGFIEGSTGKLTLKADWKIMNFLVRWLYTQELEEDLRSMEDMFLLWILADRLLMPRLQNQVMDYYFKSLRRNLGESAREYISRSSIGEACRKDIVGYAGMLRKIWKHTCAGSPLREVLVKSWAELVSHEDVKRKAHLLPKDMFLDIALYFMENDNEEAAKRRNSSLGWYGFMVKENLDS